MSNRENHCTVRLSAHLMRKLLITISVNLHTKVSSKTLEVAVDVWNHLIMTAKTAFLTKSHHSYVQPAAIYLAVTIVHPGLSYIQGKDKHLPNPNTCTHCHTFAHRDSTTCKHTYGAPKHNNCCTRYACQSEHNEQTSAVAAGALQKRNCSTVHTVTQN